MDGSEFLERVRTENATALDRLGSEKALVAATAATLERSAVLEAAATAEARAVDTFDAWAADEKDRTARGAFETAAEREREHLELVSELGETAVADPPADALHEHLRGLEKTVPRVAAGLVARPLVASRSLLQVINFFVNEGSTDEAAVFRELRAETDEQAERGSEVLTAVCEDEQERAAEAAEAAIETAYDEYAETLSGFGIDPKPVC